MLFLGLRCDSLTRHADALSPVHTSDNVAKKGRHCRRNRQYCVVGNNVAGFGDNVAVFGYNVAGLGDVAGFGDNVAVFGDIVAGVDGALGSRFTTQTQMLLYVFEMPLF